MTDSIENCPGCAAPMTVDGPADTPFPFPSPCAHCAKWEWHPDENRGWEQTTPETQRRLFNEMVWSNRQSPLGSPPITYAGPFKGIAEGETVRMFTPYLPELPQLRIEIIVTLDEDGQCSRPPVFSMGPRDGSTLTTSVMLVPAHLRMLAQGLIDAADFCEQGDN